MSSVRFVRIVFLDKLLHSERETEGEVAAAEAQPTEHSKIVKVPLILARLGIQDCLFCLV